MKISKIFGEFLGSTFMFNNRNYVLWGRPICRVSNFLLKKYYRHIMQCKDFEKKIQIHIHLYLSENLMKRDRLLFQAKQKSTRMRLTLKGHFCLQLCYGLITNDTFQSCMHLDIINVCFVKNNSHRYRRWSSLIKRMCCAFQDRIRARLGG